MVGEYYSSTGADALQRLEDFYAKGYAGAWAWSLFWDRTNDKMQVDLAAAATFTGRHADTGPRSGSAPPPVTTPTPTPTPAPTGSTVTIDNAKAAFTGTWTASTSVPGFYATNYQHDGNAGKGTKTARFTPALGARGAYRVLERHTAAVNRASNVPVTIRASGASTTVRVNQRVNHATWVDLGTYQFAAGGGEYVEIATGGTDGVVIADAIRFEPGAPIGRPARSWQPGRC